MKTQFASSDSLWTRVGTRLVWLCLLMAFTSPAIALPPTNETLLVGNRFGLVPADVLFVDSATGSVSGVWGDAVDFNPAPGAMAQDSQGRVYILDTNRDRIQRFDSRGNFIDIFASAPLRVNGLHYGLAIDAADNVYVSSDGPETFNIRDDAIVRFSPSGVYLGTFGEARNNVSGFIAGGPLKFDAAGNLYTSHAGKITRYSSSGTYLGVFADTFALQLAFDSSGQLYTASSDILRFSADGTPLGTFATGFGSGGLAIDSQGNVYASDLEHDQVRKFAPDGSVLATIIHPTMDGPGNLLVLVPEPGLWMMIGIVLLLGVCGWRTRESRS